MPSQPQDTQCTQGVSELGHTNYTLTDRDIADIICILHPCSPAAFKITSDNAVSSPQHILQACSDPFDSQGTFCSDPMGNLDLALRFSSVTGRPALGFTFGRNPSLCDIVLESRSFKRVSNVHFRIFVTNAGVCMIEDMSTNGTLVDDFVLRGKGLKVAQTRMLSAGSIIQILSPNPKEIVKFIVRIPSRQGHEDAYTKCFRRYMERSQLAQADRPDPPRPDTRLGQPYLQNSGMHWNGGNKYNCIDLLGKGAFASVYRLANKTDGQLFAAKELDKRRFVKNGVIDSKLNNEMRIMETISHPNIVKFIEHHESDPYLYIIMEYMPFGDLQHLLSTSGILGGSLPQTMARQVFDAMTYLHSQNITHRDIKPDNILIAVADPSSFTVKLSDFGLSKVVKDNETFLKTFCGTLLYCAPEVFPQYASYVAENKTKDRRHQHRHREYSQSVDVWSFGAVMWFSMCGQPPFEGVTDATGRGMFERLMHDTLDFQPLVDHSVSSLALDLLGKMLQQIPADRLTAHQCLHHPWFEPDAACQDMSQLALDSDPFEFESNRVKRRRTSSDVSPPPGQAFASSGVLGGQELTPLAVLPQNIVASANPLMIEHVFAKPLPRLGQLVTTPDSFTSIILNLNCRRTSWGRGLKNTVRFADPTNTEIPKRGMILVFYAQGILEAEALGQDWTKMPGLHCLLATDSTYGVSVNGIKLEPKDSKGRGLCCKLHTGDVIRIDSSHRGLSFVCEFYHGEAKTPRKDRSCLEFITVSEPA